MEPATLGRTVEPLTRTTATGGVLRRPAGIEAEIAATLDLSLDEIRALAAAARETENTISSECITHLIRHDLRADSGQLAEELMPILLTRCESTLHRTLRGFSAAEALEVREDVLGRLAVSLVEPDDRADFFEVRFALALKRLRIDACRRHRRRERGRVPTGESNATSEEGLSADPPFDLHCPEPARQEDRLLIHQALASLNDSEREIFVLHKLAGMPLNSKVSGEADLVSLLGFSERTLRNRLRTAEAKLQSFRRALHD